MCKQTSECLFGTVVYNLVEGQDVQQTEAAIEEYRKANYADIVANDAKKVGSTQTLVNTFVAQAGCCRMQQQRHTCL